MESTNNNNNNNNNQMFLCEFKELRNEISAMKTRIVQLEKSHEKQQEKLDILVRENHALKTELSINGNKAVGSTLKRKRTEKDQDQGTEEQIEAKSTSVSAGKKKTKTNNNNNIHDDDEAVVLSRYDNRDSFDSLSDDLLHKIVEFDGNCYSKFGSINKRCKNIYDVEEYKLKKHTCVFGYGTLDMMLEQFLQKRREGTLDDGKRMIIAKGVIIHNRLDAIEWIIQLGDSKLLQWVCIMAVRYGRISILTKVFCKCNLTMLDKLLNDDLLCYLAARFGKLNSLKWVRKYGAKWEADTFKVARERGHDEILHYLRAEGCPETGDEDGDESSESEQVSSDDEDGDY